MDGEIKLPIVPELNLEATKKAYNQIENYFIDKVGKKFQIENAKMIDSQKRMYQAFVKVGQKYASIMYQVNKKGELKDIPKIAEYLSGPNKGKLRTLTRKQAMKLNEANTINQYRRTLGDIIPKSRKKSLTKNGQVDSVSADSKIPKTLSGFTKLLNTFKRVGFYRIARRSFQLIEQGFAKGLQNIAKFSPEVNKSLSSITSQFTILANSVANVFVPFLKLVEPLLKNITTSIANMSNVISYLIAKLKGSSKYLKVNTEYLSDFNKEVNNFSFDKFEALSSDDTANMFIESDVSQGLTSDLEDAKNLLNIIFGILVSYEGIKIIKWLLDNKLSGTVKDVKTIKDSCTLMSSLSFSSFNIMLTTLAGVVALIGTFKLFDWLLQDATKGQAVLITLLGTLLAIATTFAFIKSLAVGNVLGAMASAVGTMASLGMIIAGAKQWATKSVEQKANGGMVDSGSLFIAGEAGAELVTTSSSGQTGVTNIAQFKQAMLEALYEWSSSSSEGENYIVLNIDGAEVARSKRFKDELNRTNTQLNLR